MGDRPDPGAGEAAGLTCANCGLRVTPDLTWCPRCLEPLGRVASAEGPRAGPVPGPAPATEPPPGRVTPESLRGAAGATRDASKPDWEGMGPRPTTRWHRTATTSGPGVKVGLTALVLGVLVAGGLLMPWGRFAPLSGFILIAATALAVIFLAGLWRRGEVDAAPGPPAAGTAGDVRPPP